MAKNKKQGAPAQKKIKGWIQKNGWWKPTPATQKSIDLENHARMMKVKDELFIFISETLRDQHAQAKGDEKIYLQGKKDGMRIAYAMIFNDPSMSELVNRDPVARAKKQAEG